MTKVFQGTRCKIEGNAAYDRNRKADTHFQPSVFNRFVDSGAGEEIKHLRKENMIGSFSHPFERRTSEAAFLDQKHCDGKNEKTRDKASGKPTRGDDFRLVRGVMNERDKECANAQGSNTEWFTWFIVLGRQIAAVGNDGDVSEYEKAIESAVHSIAPLKQFKEGIESDAKK